MSAALLAAYAACGAYDLTNASTLATLTMLDPGDISRAQACAIQKAPSRFTSMTPRNSSGVSRSAGTAVPMPALLTRMSSRPYASVAARASTAQSCGSVTSVRRATTAPPPALIPLATSVKESSRRAPSTTAAPASLRAWAKPRPKPELAPVITAPLPSRRNRSMIVTTERANPSEGHDTANVDAGVHVDGALRYLVEAVAAADQLVGLERALPVEVEHAENVVGGVGHAEDRTLDVLLIERQLRAG